MEDKTPEEDLIWFLTKEEVEVVWLLCQHPDFTNHEIGGLIDKARKTISFYLNKAYGKLEITSGGRTERRDELKSRYCDIVLGLIKGNEDLDRWEDRAKYHQKRTAALRQKKSEELIENKSEGGAIHPSSERDQISDEQQSQISDDRSQTSADRHEERGLDEPIPLPGIRRGIFLAITIGTFLFLILVAFLIFFRDRIWPAVAVVNPTITTAGGDLILTATFETNETPPGAVYPTSTEPQLNSTKIPPSPNFAATTWAIATRLALDTETNIPPSPTPNNILFEDTFDEGFSSAWNVVSGKVEPSQGYISTNQPTWIEVGDPEWTDYVVDLHVENGSCDGNTVIALRYQDIGNYIGFLFACDATWLLMENGTETRHSQGVFPLGFGDMFVRVSAIGNRFQLAGKGWVEYDNYPKGKVAILLAPNTRYDLVRIYKGSR